MISILRRSSAKGPSYDIRRLSKPADSPFLAGLVELRREAYETNWPHAAAPVDAILKDRILLEQTPEPRWVAIDQNDKVVAAACLYRDPVSPSVRIIDIRVSNCRRRQGIGTALLTVAMSECKRLGVATVLCATSSRSNGADAFALRCRAVRERVLCHYDVTPGFYAARRNSYRRDAMRRESIDIQIVTGLPSRVQCKDVRRLAKRIHATYRQDMLYESDASAEVLQTSLYRNALSKGCHLWLVMAHAGDRCVGFHEYLWDPLMPDVLKHIGIAVDIEYQCTGVAIELLATDVDIVKNYNAVHWCRYTRQLGTLDAHSNEVCEKVLYETRWRLPVA